MILELGDRIFPEPTRDVLRAALELMQVDETLLLAKSDDEFVNSIRVDDAKFGVQYREGSASDMWSGPDVDRATHDAIFLSYLAGDDKWRAAVEWVRDGISPEEVLAAAELAAKAADAKRELEEITQRFEKTAAEAEAVVSAAAKAESAVSLASTSNNKASWQDQFPPEQRITPMSFIFALIGVGAMAYLFNSCESRSSYPSQPSVDYSRITQSAIGCPTKPGIELVLEAAKQGDGAVAATSLVNNCTTIPAGTAVSVVEAGFSYMQIKESSTGRVSWVVSDVAFAR